MKEKGKKNLVILDKNKLQNFSGSIDTVKDYPVRKEFTKILGYKNDEQVILKVKGASLDDQITCQNLAKKTPFILMHVLSLISNSEKFDFEKLLEQIEDDRLNDNTIFELNLFERNVIDPKFTFKEVYEISEKIPEFVNEVVKFSLGLTDNYHGD